MGYDEGLGPKGMRSYGNMAKSDEDLTAIIEKLLLVHETILNEVSSVNK